MNPINSDQWVAQMTGRAMELAEMDPEIIFRMNAYKATERLHQSVAALVSIIVLLLLATAVPIVMLTWKAAL